MVIETEVAAFLASGLPVIDVRSPSEFLRGHIPGAANIPLFTDEERAAVGKAYVQESPGKAMSLGYSFAEPAMEGYVTRSAAFAGGHKAAVHCWRGGMRSNAFAGHLLRNGFTELLLLRGGYKAYRNHVLDFFNTPPKLKIVGGYTGSGKTALLRQLALLGCQTIDLEAVANHRGSSFGSMGRQPTQEQFENDLFEAFRTKELSRPVWLEDESRNIGGVTLPKPLYLRMLDSELYFLDIPAAERVKRIVDEYAGEQPELLAEAIGRISRRLGNQAAREALRLLNEKQWTPLVSLILDYYDKTYRRGLLLHRQDRITPLPSEDTSPEKNCTLLLAFDSANRIGHQHPETQSPPGPTLINPDKTPDQHAGTNG